MAEKKYYWTNPNGNFGGGDQGIKFGEEMPNLSPEQEKIFLEKKWISKEKKVTERQLSELEQLKEQVANLKKNASGEGSGITQEQLDEAKAESVQADLDRIAELESGDVGELQGKLDIISESLESIQQGDSKAEIWDAVKSVKDLLKEGE